MLMLILHCYLHYFPLIKTRKPSRIFFLNCSKIYRGLTTTPNEFRTEWFYSGHNGRFRRCLSRVVLKRSFMAPILGRSGFIEANPNIQIFELSGVITVSMSVL